MARRQAVPGAACALKPQGPAAAMAATARLLRRPRCGVHTAGLAVSPRHQSVTVTPSARTTSSAAINVGRPGQGRVQPGPKHPSGGCRVALTARPPPGRHLWELSARGDSLTPRGGLALVFACCAGRRRDGGRHVPHTGWQLWVCGRRGGGRCSCGRWTVKARTPRLLPPSGPRHFTWVLCLVAKAWRRGGDQGDWGGQSVGPKRPVHHPVLGGVFLAPQEGGAVTLAGERPPRGRSELWGGADGGGGEGGRRG